MEQTASSLSKRVDDVFNAGGLLQREFPGFEPRPEQTKLTQGIAYYIENERHLLAKAPAGIGKSIAYLVPALLYDSDDDSKIIVSTFTKALQKQLVDKDIPLMKRAIGDFEHALCIGGHNYLCMRKLIDMRDMNLFESNDESGIAEKILRAHDKGGISIAQDLEFNVDKMTWRKICRDRYTCNKRCRYTAVCGFFENIKLQKSAKVLIANHHLLFNNIKTASAIIGKTRLYILDEAHEIEDIVTEVFSLPISSFGIKSVLNEIYNVEKKTGLITKTGLNCENRKDIKSAVVAVNEVLDEIRSRLGEGDQKADRNHLDIVASLIDPLSELHEHLYESSSRPLEFHKKQIAEINADILTLCSDEGWHGYVYWKSVKKKRWEIKASPINVSGILRNKLFHIDDSKKNGNGRDETDNSEPDTTGQPVETEDVKKRTAIFISATLSVAGNMNFFRNRIGLNSDDCGEMIVSSPFNFKRQAVIYLPQDIPEPDDDDYPEAVLQETANVIKFMKGRTLILFTSFKFMNETYEKLAPLFPYLMFLKQGDEQVDKLLSDFKNNPNSILMGAKTFWQGIDIPGDALQCVIVTKLPFLVPNDPVTEARCEALEKKGLNAFTFYHVPRAIWHYEQGFGRLIRTSTDKGLFVNLDVRVLTKSYGSMFLKALPDCRRISSLSELTEGFLQK